MSALLNCSVGNGVKKCRGPERKVMISPPSYFAERGDTKVNYYWPAGCLQDGNCFSKAQLVEPLKQIVPYIREDINYGGAR